MVVEATVSREHPAPEDVRRRLDEAVSRDVPVALASMIARLCPENDPSLWFIHDLEIDVEVNAAWDSSRLASTWGRKVALAVSQEIEAGPRGDCVVRFENRTAYLARFLADLAAGAAWNRWYYQAFEGLRALPVSSALRTAIISAGDSGADALLDLSPSEFEAVLRSLTTVDARRVLEYLFPAGEVSARDIESAWSALRQVASARAESEDEDRRLLRICLAVLRTGPPPGAGFARAARSLLRLASLVSTAPDLRVAKVIDALRERDVASLWLAAGPADAEALQPLLRADESLLAAIVADQRAGRTDYSPGSDAARDSADTRYTPFGAAFLLLPILASIPLDEKMADWPDADGVPAATVARFLILAACCGSANARRVLNDLVVRDLCGIPGAMGIESIAAWANSRRPAQMRKLHSSYRRWLFESEAASGSDLILTTMKSASRREVVALDSGRGVWLHIAPARRPERVVADFAHDLARAADENTLILCGTELFEAIHSAHPEARTLVLQDVDVETDELADTLARLDMIGEDRRHVSLPRSIGLRPEAERLFSVIAQGALRAFAWRLPGFARSSIPYLWSNFLNVSALVEDEASRRVVQLSRPPLHLILNMTGMARATYRLDWLDDRPIVIFPLDT